MSDRADLAIAPATHMTVREEFARSAMIGLLADHKDHSDECADGENCPQTVARLAAPNVASKPRPR